MNWDNVRSARNKLLAKTDWTQCSDVQASMSDQEKNDWILFRAKLRDLTKDFDSPENVVFPQPPRTNF